MVKKRIINILKNKVVKGLIAIILPIIIELLICGKIAFDRDCLIRILFIYGIYFIIGIYHLLKKYKNTLDKIASFIIKKRYLIATALLIVTVLLKINLSSINMWYDYAGEEEKSNVVIGESRSIRSDEWLAQSTMILGQIQGQDAYKIYNKNIAQGSQNMVMSIMPVRDITSLCKPLIWGYLLFGKDYGFSFYWMLKIILLFMVSLEFSMKISKKDNLLTLSGALIFSLAPAIMWWLSSAIADGYIFGMLTIVLFSYYMNNLDWKIWKKAITAIGLLISLTSFAVVLYPAFQVPFAFVMAIVMLNDFISNIKKIKKVDIFFILLTILGIIILLGRYVFLSFEDMKIMMNTVYPGNRISLGGDFTLDRFISYSANIFFPYSKNIQNPCEASAYIYPFTGVLILLVYNINNIKKKNKDTFSKLIVSLTGLYVLFILWEFIGFGENFAKFTLLSMVPTQRLNVVIGFIGTTLAIMLLKSNGKTFFTKLQAMVISIIIAIISYILIKNTSYASFFNATKYEIWMAIIFVITYFLITKNKKAWCYSMVIVSIIAGATVNPIAIGTSPIEETKIANAIKIIKQEENDALWVGNSNLNGQYLIANGTNTLNGVHSYPNFQWLKIVDPEGKYNEVYNRFAHIHINLGDNTEFELLAPDAYIATLTYENLKELNVKYYYTNKKCSENEMIKFNLESKYVDDEKNQYIYLIK